MNEKQEAIYLISGSRSSGNRNLGQNKLFTNSNGISLRRGGITISDALVTVGEIGPTGSDNNFYINGNSTNNIIIDSAAGRTNCYSNGIDIYRGTGGRNIIGSIEPNISDINDTSLYIKSFNDLNFYAGLGSISLGGNGPIKKFSTGMNFYSAGLFANYYGGYVGLTDICSNTFFINTNLTNPLYLNSGAANLTLNSTNNINIRSNNINVGIGNDNVFVRTVNNSVLMMESPNALFLTSKVVYVGSKTPQNGYYSTLAFYNSNGTAMIALKEPTLIL
jgi:hypothetical protein